MMHHKAAPISRRRLAHTAAWSAPMLLATTQVPVYAASPSTKASTLFNLLASQDTANAAPDTSEMALGLWFTPPVDAATGKDLGGSTTLAPGAIFTLTVTLTYREGQTPAAPAGWEDGAQYTYQPFGTPGAEGSQFNSATVTAAFGTGSVRGQTWTGTATFTTVDAVSVEGLASATGAQVLFPDQALGFDLLSIDYGNISGRITTGKLIVTPAEGAASEVDVSGRSVMNFIEGTDGA